MNIVYLIGNGFDINLGMQTRYDHFYDYYTKLEDCSKCVINLKDSIKRGKDNWSDLEQALGLFTKEMDSEKDAIDIYNSLLSNLRDYLTNEEDKYSIDEKFKKILIEDLISPEKYLLPTEEGEFRQFKDIKGNLYIRIISFNYTTPIEKILNYPSEKFSISRGRTPYSVILSEIEHIHGTTNSGMVLGVNDKSQLSNEDLKSSKKIVNRYIKSACNGTYKRGHDVKCTHWIDNSNILCLFGLSFGDTDKQWWEAIGRRLLKNGCKLIIFHYIDNFSRVGNWGPNYDDAVDEVKNIFLSKTGLTNEQKKTVISKIYVSISSNIFKIKAVVKNEDNGNTSQTSQSLSTFKLLSKETKM